MAGSRGEVWWGPALHKSAASYRPWLIVSDGSTPFAETEAIVLALTTQSHDAGIAVPDEAWTRGGSEKRAFVSPWYVTTMKRREFDDLQGELSVDLVREAIGCLREYVPIEPDGPKRS